MKDLDLGGIRLAYQETGSGDPVLLLHPGFVADGMAPLLGAPALSGYRLVAYHRRGYGESDRALPPVSLAQQADDAVALLDRLAIARAHVVGHSLGGTIAIQLAVSAPERIGALVLMDPLVPWALSPTTAEFVAETAAAAIPRLAAGDSAGAVDTFLNGAFGPGYRPALDRALPAAWETAVADAATAFGVELAAVQDWAVGAEELAGMRRPTLSVVNCEERWAGFREIHDALQTAIPSCEGVRVDVPSHLLQIYDAGPVAAAIAEFLARHPLPAAGDDAS